MKTFLLSALLCAAFFTQISAQTYQPFPTQNAVWRSVSFDVYEDVQYQDAINGDTVINSKVYHKIFRTEKSTSKNVANPPPPQTSGPSYIGAFREENKRIYFERRGLSGEYLGYDFNLKIGDTLPRNALNNMGIRIITDTFSMTGFADNIKRKIYRTKRNGTSLPVDIAEGIGASRDNIGIFPPWNIPPTDPVYRSLCAVQNGVSVWIFSIPIPENTDCESLTATRDPRLEMLSISPNPLSDVSAIRVENWEQLLGGSLEVSDVAGRLLFQKTIQSESDFRLQRSDFQAGMLLVSVKSRQGVLRYVGKLIAE